jgi:hypothetical protein
LKRATEGYDRDREREDDDDDDDVHREKKESYPLDGEHKGEEEEEMCRSQAWGLRGTIGLFPPSGGEADVQDAVQAFEVSRSMFGSERD